MKTSSMSLHSLEGAPQKKEAVDVAIVGGGPGGLITAIALKRAMPGAKIKVLERTATLAPRGAMMAVASDAVKLLDAVDPSLVDPFQALNTPIANSKTYGGDGAVLPGPGFGAPPPPPAAPGAPAGPSFMPLLSRWYKVQETLYKALPADSVELGAKYKHFTVNDSGAVHVSYERVSGTAAGLGGSEGDSDAAKTSSGEEIILEAKILIGSDGINSLVRNQVLGVEGFEGDWGRIGLSPPDSIIIRGMVEKSDLLNPSSAATAGLDAASLHTLQSDMGSNRWYFGGPKGLGFIIRFDEFLAWSFTAPLALLASLGLDVSFDGSSRPIVRQADSKGDTVAPGEIMKRIAAGIAGSEYGNLLATAVSVTPAKYVTQHLYSTTADPLTTKWGEGPVTLLGESMHALGPTGVGFTLAVQDAYELASALREHGLTSDALRRYEASRRQLIRRVYDKTKEGHQAALSSAPGGVIRMWTEGGIRDAIQESVSGLKPLVRE